MHRLLRTSAPTSLLLGALTAPAFAQAVPTDGLDLMAVVTGLLSTVNVPVLTMLAVLAFAFHRIQAITAAWAIILPIAVGALLGALSAMAHAQQTAGGWLMVAALTQSMIEGAAINGGMAVVIGRLASVGLEKLWPPPPANS